MNFAVKELHVAIVGLGQLGASLALRLKELECGDVMAVARRQETIDQALEQGMIDRGNTDAAEILPQADITFICVPLTASIDFAKDNVGHFRKGSIVTDVGSVKGSIVDALRPLFVERDLHFVGSHPMAGSEKSGIDAAAADLYQDAICFLTPTSEDCADFLRILSDVWQEIGSCVIELEAGRHDQAVAYSSHLLHMVSAAVVQCAMNQGDPEAQKISAAGGFRDVSRIAASNVEMWTEISKHNGAAIHKTLDVFISEMESIRDAFAAEDWDAVSAYLKVNKETRDEWFADYASERGYREGEQV